ncbi:hypothetical protein DFJ74DRAFT_81339 [Hyaloraphidium curvatum]|nr:hypothetical protein DFJ74DRAFT_81339 [Hyaloraphidium curvatum]
MPSCTPTRCDVSSGAIVSFGPCFLQTCLSQVAVSPAQVLGHCSSRTWSTRLNFCRAATAFRFPTIRLPALRVREGGVPCQLLLHPGKLGPMNSYPQDEFGTDSPRMGGLDPRHLMLTNPDPRLGKSDARPWGDRRLAVDGNCSMGIGSPRAARPVATCGISGMVRATDSRRTVVHFLAMRSP